MDTRPDCSLVLRSEHYPWLILLIVRVAQDKGMIPLKILIFPTPWMQHFNANCCYASATFNIGTNVHLFRHIYVLDATHVDECLQLKN
jgi:hypothetical protein